MAFSSSGRREDVSVRLRAGNLHTAKETTKQLEIDSRRMEERLTELKLAMNREKEERERHQGGFWKTGQIGNLSSYGKDATHKAAIKEAKREKKKKVKVLKDEPIVAPDRQKGPGTMAFIAKKGSAGSISNRSAKDVKVKGPKCGQCEEKGAHVSCVECGEDYCASCFASFHLKGALKKHRSLPIGSNNVRTPRGPSVEPQSVTNGDPVPANSMSEPNIMKVTLTDIDFGFAQDAVKEVESAPLQGESLLDGEYDEGSAAADFQEALRAWRGEKPQQDVPRVVPNNTASPVARSETSTSTVDLSSKSPVDIKFKNSLTYAEKLMLKRHRRTQLGTLPDYVMDKSDARFDMQYRGSESRLGDLDPEYLPDEEQHVDFQSMYVAMGLPQCDSPKSSASRPESRVSIVEIDAKSSRRRHRGVEETSEYEVTETQDDRSTTSSYSSKAHIKSAGPPKTRKAFASPTPKSSIQRADSPSKTRMSSSKNSTPPNKMISSHNQSRVKASVDASEGKENSTPRVKSSLRKNTGRRASVESQSTPRPQSRAKSRAGSRAGHRPDSRAKSRAEIKMALFGEGTLTKKPSESLHQIAGLARSLEPVQYDSQVHGLGEFFTAGVVPSAQPERTLTPSGKRKSGDDQKWKVSNKLYSMAPRSWRPDSSLGDTVDEDNVVIDDGIMGTYRSYMDLARQEGKNVSQREMLSYSHSTGDVTTWRRESSIIEPTTASVSNVMSQQPVLAKTPPHVHSYDTSQNLVSSLHQSTDTLRASVVCDQQTPRAVSRSGRDSVMIVPDGDDMSEWDQSNIRLSQDQDDEDTIVELERELTSQASYRHDDGYLSQLSMSLDTTQASSGEEDLDISNTNNNDMDNRLRESMIMNDFEEMEARLIEEEADDMADVKALS